MRKKSVISDSSAIITLDKINELDILRAIYQTITITDIVHAEIGKKFPDWINVEDAYNKKLYESLRLRLDDGEASSIALALEGPDSLLILDERKGRRIAKDHGLQLV